MDSVADVTGPANTATYVLRTQNSLHLPQVRDLVDIPAGIGDTSSGSTTLHEIPAVAAVAYWLRGRRRQRYPSAGRDTVDEDKNAEIAGPHRSQQRGQGARQLRTLAG